MQVLTRPIFREGIAEVMNIGWYTARPLPAWKNLLHRSPVHITDVLTKNEQGAHIVTSNPTPATLNMTKRTTYLYTSPLIFLRPKPLTRESFVSPRLWMRCQSRWRDSELSFGKQRGF